MKKKFLGCMAALATLLAVSCTSDPSSDANPSDGFASDEVEVRFSISPESVKASTRVDAEEQDRGGRPGYMQTIGKGKNVDMLIYAVYDEDGKLLTQYGSDEIPESLKDANALSEDKEDAKRNGQKILYVGEDFPKGESVEISLRLMRNKVYQIVFWAQSSKTTAFDTKDLEKVEVKYDEAKNNDELRDVFCKVEKFSVSTTSNSTREVILYRPMAQINVGTTLADYKNMMSGKLTFPNYTYTQSKIELRGVATEFNVLKDEITAPSEPKTATFTYGIIPAFINYEGIPDYFYAKNSTVESSDEQDQTDDENEADQSATTEPKVYVDNEEFLYVDLDGDGEIMEGKGEDYPTIINEKYQTETFKYLSMCYVLVPAKKVQVPNYGDSNGEATTDASGEVSDVEKKYNAAVLTSVNVWFAETKKEGNNISHERQVLALKNVPVQRNYRTNILGGLSPTPDPTDDPRSIFDLTQVLVKRDPSFDGDYNKYDAMESDAVWMQK